MTRREDDRFDQAFRNWASRPSDTSPEEAARRVVARIDRRRPGERNAWRPLRWATAAASLIVVLVAAWWVGSGQQAPGTAGNGIFPPPLSEDVVLLWLDDETPLYLTVAPPATKGDSG